MNGDRDVTTSRLFLVNFVEDLSVNIIIFSSLVQNVMGNFASTCGFACMRFLRPRAAYGGSISVLKVYIGIIDRSESSGVKSWYMCEVSTICFH